MRIAIDWGSARCWIKSVMKKFKDRAFAAGISREDVRDGAEELGVDLKDHIQFVIEAMREIAPELGFAGGNT